MQWCYIKLEVFQYLDIVAFKYTETIQRGENDQNSSNSPINVVIKSMGKWYNQLGGSINHMIFHFERICVGDFLNNGKMKLESIFYFYVIFMYVVILLKIKFSRAANFCISKHSYRKFNCKHVCFLISWDIYSSNFNFYYPSHNYCFLLHLLLIFLSIYYIKLYYKCIAFVSP